MIYKQSYSIDENTLRLISDISKGIPHHILFCGGKTNTHAALQKIYSMLKDNNDLLCSWHDSDNIKSPIDFLEPALKLKYSEKLYAEKIRLKKEYIKTSMEKKFRTTVSYLTDLLGKDSIPDKTNPNSSKLHIFFITEIEKLLYNMDYLHKDTEVKEYLLGSSTEAPRPRGFGDSLRDLHQYNKAAFLATVDSDSSNEYMMTLGNYKYLFYTDNFKSIIV